MSWGSRPTENNQADAFKAVERKKDILYKDYRSRFLIFWALCNLIVGYYMVFLYTSGQKDIIFYIGAFLTSTLVFRIVFSTIHNIKARWDKFKVRQHCKRQVSTVFNDLNLKIEDDKKENIFEIYFDNQGNSALIKQDDPRFTQQSAVKSSIKAQNVYRGFSLVDINKKHQISQSGLIDNNRLSNRNPPVYTHEMEKFFEEDEDSSEDEEEFDSDSSAEDQGEKRTLSIQNSEPRPNKVLLPRIEGMSPSIVNPFQTHMSR